MDKIKIGIPRALFYYYFGNLWQSVFTKLGCDVIISPKTNKQILNRGSNIANDEMCLSLKIYLGHIDYLKDLCDYIIIPRIDNYNRDNQTCTNFLSIYDIVNNLFQINILNYNINELKNSNELKGIIKIGQELNFKKKDIIKAYKEAKKELEQTLRINRIKNYKKLNTNKKHILLISHPYNTYDEIIGKPIIDNLNELDIEVIYSDSFDSNLTNKLSTKISKTLYWKYSKESIGSYEIVKNKIDGVIFLSSFPCGLDSLVNELMITKIKKPYLNLIIDDVMSETGLITRLESFKDILDQ